MLGSKHHVCESHTVLHMYTPESTPSALQQCAAPSYTLPRKPHNLIFIHISNYMYVFIYIYICLCVCVCVVSPLPETYLFGTRPRVQAQKTFFDIRPNSTHVRPQRICLVPLLSSPVPTHAYLSIFHPSLSSSSWEFEQIGEIKMLNISEHIWTYLNISEHIWTCHRKGRTDWDGLSRNVEQTWADGIVWSCCCGCSFMILQWLWVSLLELTESTTLEAVSVLFLLIGVRT